jgi:hypothetical protein
VQALCQQFAANVEAATALRQQELAERGCIQTAYPQHAKVYQTVVWMDQALTAAAAVVAGVPESQPASGSVDLADHYELCLTAASSA